MAAVNEKQMETSPNTQAPSSVPVEAVASAPAEETETNKTYSLTIPQEPPAYENPQVTCTLYFKANDC